jgi:hypothetical protein
MNGLTSYGPIDPVDWAISRTVTVPHTVPVPTEMLILNSNQQTDWELTVREVSGIADIKLTVTLSQAASSYILEQPVNRGGAWKYQGYGAVQVVAEVMNAPGPGVLEVSIQPVTNYASYVAVPGQTTLTLLAVAGAWTPIPNLTDVTPAGYAPPFCTLLTIRPSFDCNLRALDMTGAFVWQTGNLTRDDIYWRNIPVLPWYQLEIAPLNAGTGLTNLWHNGHY